MKNENLDYSFFYPEVLQAVAGENFTVYAYMSDGNMRLFDVKPLIKNGGVFSKIADENIFKEKLTVLNNTIAWDIGGNRDEYKCIDIDPFTLYELKAINSLIA